MSGALKVNTTLSSLELRRDDEIHKDKIKEKQLIDREWNWS